MRINFRYINLVVFILLSGIFSEVFSSGHIKTNHNKTYFINNSKNLVANKEKVQRVTVKGFGISVSAARKDAAKNGVSQVVGSFIDSDTIYKKKTIISDDFFSETKVFEKNIKDYSQGTIISFETLNVTKNGLLYEVTAVMDVRIDNLKAYIEKKANNKTSLDQGNLTIIDFQNSNTKNKFSLLRDFIDRASKGNLINIKQIGKQQILEDLSAFGCKYTEIASMPPSKNINCWSYSPVTNINVRDFSKRETIVIPYSFQLDKDFVENSINVLDNISDNLNTLDISKRNKIEDNRSYGDNYYVEFNFSDLKLKKSYKISSISNQNKYSFDNLLKENYPKLKVSFLNNQNAPVCSLLFDVRVKPGPKTEGNCLGSKVAIDYVIPRGMYSGSDYRQGVNILFDWKFITVFDKVNFFIFIEPNQRFSETISSLDLKFVR